MRANEFLSEFTLPKNTWQLVTAANDKEEISDELVALVQKAYTSTLKGSFVNSVSDVLPSDWLVVDWDKDPGLDATVFYRKQRADETWIGHKIQGIGHDGQSESKSRAIAKVQHLLQRDGWWIESSHAMRLALMKLNTPIVTNEEILRRLFPNSFVRMIDAKTYIRTINKGMLITESVFGKPRVKGL